MHKDKNGNVTASLTDVKNKTGDIFALVDQFGEVLITSYNKPRYRISKIDVSTILSEEKDVKKKTVSKKKVIGEKEDAAEKKINDFNEINIDRFERSNELELSFIKKATKSID